MALYFSEGFDQYTAATSFVLGGWTKQNDASDLYLTLDSTGSRWGGKCLKMESRSTQANMWKSIPVAMSGTVIRIAFWIKTSTTLGATAYNISSIPILALEDGTPSNWIDIRLDTSAASTEGYAGAGGLFVSRTETQRSGLTDMVNFFLPSKKRIIDGEWHHVELYMSINNSTGAFKMWIDGDLQCDVSSHDTSDGATNISTFTRVRVSSGWASNTAAYCWLDDIIVWDDSGTEFTGELPNHIHRIDTIYPDGAGASANFTPSTGSNYQNVDEVPANDDTDYNESSTVGHIDSFSFGNMNWTANEVFAVNVKARAKYDSTSANFRTKFRISSTYYNGATVALTASYGMIEQIWNNDPSNTANNLTTTVINAAEFGYERVT